MLKRGADHVSERLSYAVEVRMLEAEAEEADKEGPPGQVTNWLRFRELLEEESERRKTPLTHLHQTFVCQRPKKRVSFPVATVEAMAKILQVRPEWLAFGTGAMDSDPQVFADPSGELYLMNGAASAKHENGEDPYCRRPKTPKALVDQKVPFMDAFESKGGAELLGQCTYTVQIVFANVVSRFMQRYRDAKKAGLVRNARWRGGQAADLISKAWDLATKEGGFRPNDPTGPQSNAAMLATLARMSWGSEGMNPGGAPRKTEK